MLRFSLKKETEYEYIYSYFPNGEGDGGEVVVSRETGDVTSYKTAKGDEDRWFMRHFVSKLIKFKNDNAYDSSGIIAWY